MLKNTAETFGISFYDYSKVVNSSYNTSYDVFQKQSEAKYENGLIKFSKKEALYLLLTNYTHSQEMIASIMLSLGHQIFYGGNWYVPSNNSILIPFNMYDNRTLKEPPSNVKSFYVNLYSPREAGKIMEVIYMNQRQLYPDEEISLLFDHSPNEMVAGVTYEIKNVHVDKTNPLSDPLTCTLG